MRVLLVEDDPLLGDGLAVGLAQLGFAVDWVKDGLAAEHSLSVESFDAMVLDLGLPRRDGLSVLRQARAAGSRLPILILTARDALDDKIKGLDAGADDYLVKPVDLRELAARLRALLRRAQGQANPLLKVGAISLDPATREVRCHEQIIELSAREFDILHVLMQHAGRVLTRTQIEQSIYGWNDETGSNTVEVHIHHLRKKLSFGGHAGNDFIRTLRGVGYQIRQNVKASK